MNGRITLKEFELCDVSAHPFVSSSSKNILKDLESKLQINIIRKEGNDLEFDIIGIDPSLANAFRRLMLSDVPSVAIEKVHIYNNTSLIQDEVLAHRLGLIPLKVSPKDLEWKSSGESDEGNEFNTLEFELLVKCTAKKIKGSGDGEETLENEAVYSDSLVWIPKGSQKSRLGLVSSLEKDILIAKLRRGHEIDMRLFAVKGRGRDHAKFSPVSTAYYRLYPKIELKEKIDGERAERLQKSFSSGVIGRDEAGVAFVADSRYDMCSRNALRFEDLKTSVLLSKVKDHFIFTVESVGAIEPEDIFLESVEILYNKCSSFLLELDSKLN